MWHRHCTLVYIFGNTRTTSNMMYLHIVLCIVHIHIVHMVQKYPHSVHVQNGMSKKFSQIYLVMQNFVIIRAIRVRVGALD